eukprot:1497236-Prymnesium_polylepis.1
MPPRRLLVTMRLRGGMQSHHTAEAVATARLPPPDHQEDNFVSRGISRSCAYHRTVQLDTTDPS